LFASGRVTNAQVSAYQRLDIGAGNVENLALQLRPGVDVSGQIYLDGQAPQNFRVQSIRVNLTPADGIPVNSVNATSDEGGKFVLRDVAGGRYRLSITGAQGGAYVAAGKYGGFEALGEPVDVDGEGIPVNLLIGFSSARIETVVENSGRPYSGATVVLVPSNRSRTDLFKTATSGADGKVAFSNVPPGVYKLFAWEVVKQGAYQDAAFMDRYEDRGHPVHVEKSGTASDTHLQVIRAQ
jgi:hypothetical protein